jgi:hypothetical protein
MHFKYRDWAIKGLTVLLTSVVLGHIGVATSQTSSPTQVQSTRQTGITTFYYGGYGQNPWFTAPGPRQQMNLSTQQYNQLSQAYNQAWNQYQMSVAKLGAPPLPQVQVPVQQPPVQQPLVVPYIQIQQPLNTFSTLMGNAAQNILTPEQFQRYQQLNWQYQGYGAFSDAAVQQKLNLTLQQEQQLNQLAQQYNLGLNTLYVNYNVKTTPEQYSALRQQMNQQISSILTPQQRQTWQQITGQPYNFTAPTLQQLTPTQPAQPSGNQQGGTNQPGTPPSGGSTSGSSGTPGQPPID